MRWLVLLSIALLAGCPIKADVKVDAKTDINKPDDPGGARVDAGADSAASEPVDHDKEAGVASSESDGSLPPSSDDAGTSTIDSGSPTVCVPNSTSCDNQGVTTCADDGSAWLPDHACEFGCINGVCRVCGLGAVTCNGSRIQACGETGWVNGKACALGCHSGVCNVCDPGTTQCKGSEIETCIGTGWTGTSSCSYMCIDGVCQEQLCEPGALLCDATDNVIKCDEDGLEWQTEIDCSSGCTDGICDECADDAMSCDGQVPLHCVDGSWQAQAPCPWQCDAGVCTECDSGQDDADSDGRGDLCDNCPHIANYSQVDTNVDGVGDACEGMSVADQDGDGDIDNSDNCPGTNNPGQEDMDADNVGNACDNCPSTANSGQQNTRFTGAPDLGDHCDPDLVLGSSATCAAGTTQANPIAPNLYFVIERSTSMRNNKADSTCVGTLGTTCASRSQAWNAALDMLDDTLATSSYNLGASQFPGDSGYTCTDMPVEKLKMTQRSAYGSDALYRGAFNAAARIASEAATTPTNSALRGVYDPDQDGNIPETDDPARYALMGDSIASLRAHAVVLVTGGDANTCHTDNSNNTSVLDETVDQAGQLAGMGVPVYVVGFESVNQSAMQAIANAGDPTPGTNSWYSVGNTASIIAALSNIIGRTVSCVLPLTSTGNGTADTGMMTVELVTNSNSSRVKLLSGATNGYTVAGTTVTFNGTSCQNLKQALQTDATAHIEVRAGCACVSAGAEICENDTDDDCDGRVDEGCVLTSSCNDVPAPLDCPMN